MNPINMALDEREFSEAPRPAEDNPMEIELRGYELGRRVGNRWVQVSHFRGNTLGWRQAMSDGKWLQERHPDERYQVRPIVSMKPPEVVEQDGHAMQVVTTKETNGTEQQP